MFRDGICGMFVGRVIGEQRNRQECICEGPGITSRSLHIILEEVFRRLQQVIIINLRYALMIRSLILNGVCRPLHGLASDTHRILFDCSNANFNQLTLSS